jgi:hypothetical protein
MPRRLTHRLLTTLMVVLALLFSQLALAGYACPGVEQGEGMAAMDMAAMEMAPGMPCEGMEAGGDPAQPVLCHQHCVNAPQASDPVKPLVASLPALVQVLAVPLLLDPADAGADLHANAGQARPPPDPLFLSTLRLRV